MSNVVDLSRSTVAVGTNGTVTLGQVRRIDGANLTVQDGQKLSLPLVTSYDAPDAESVARIGLRYEASPMEEATYMSPDAGDVSFREYPGLTGFLHDENISSEKNKKNCFLTGFIFWALSRLQRNRFQNIFSRRFEHPLKLPT